MLTEAKFNLLIAAAPWDSLAPSGTGAGAGAGSVTWTEGGTGDV